jgi:DNA-binding response OmpR family regulator
MNIAILEDDVAQAQAMEHRLKRANYETLISHDGRDFLAMVMKEPVDMLLLDWDVPGMTGIEVLREVRKTLSNALPIVIVTSHSGEEDIVYGLNAGADDYLIKPVSEKVLIARVAAQLRKYYPETSRAEQVEYGRYTIDTETRKIYINEGKGEPKVIDTLSAREFDMAVLLFKNVGRIVTKDSICKHIWDVVDRKYDASLATYVSKLRNVLELRRKNGLVISTIYNHGYRLERSQDM